MTDYETDLGRAARKVRDREARLDEARAERDQIIRAAIADGVTAYRIHKITGLTERAVHKIRDAR